MKEQGHFNNGTRKNKDMSLQGLQQLSKSVAHVDKLQYTRQHVMVDKRSREDRREEEKTDQLQVRGTCKAIKRSGQSLKNHKTVNKPRVIRYNIR